MNFALILLVCTAVTGVIWLLDKCYFAALRKGAQKRPKWAEQLGSFFPVFLFVLVLRSFIVEPFRIPSSSLEPTLLVGDFILVNKFAYGLRFPVLEKKFLSVGEPKRGDIVVLRWPPNEKFDFIKRVIGLPGDTISYHNKVLTINGVQAKQRFDSYTSILDEQGKLLNVEKKEEQLGDVKHNIYVVTKEKPFDFDIKVPEGNYFVMGDNRDNSSDSRYWGFVPEENLRGKAFLVWMSWDNVLKKLRWPRIGTVIR